jgi:spore germination protein YaaH
VSGLAALALAMTAAAIGTMSPAAKAATTLAVTGYAEEGTATSLIDASASGMTTVGVDGVNINSTGSAVSAPDSGAITLLKKAHADHLRAEFLVGNYSDSLGDFDPNALDKLVSSTTKTNTVVASLVNDVQSQGWDGVTVDFESILGKDEQGLVNFVTALKNAMPTGKSVSLDVTAFTNASDYPANGYNLAALGNVLDRITLMAYDEHGPTWNGVGPIGGLPWQEQALQQVLANVPASKVDLGVAGYGYTWPTSGTGEQVSDAQARQLVQNDGSTATWDSTQGEWTVTLHNGTVIWWSDARSWPLRVSLAQQYGLHGMALWSLGLSDPLPATTTPSNDFSVSSNPTSSSVIAGGSATATISTAVTSGSAQTVALTSSGAPSGTTVSFAPSSVTAGSSSTMTIATSTNTVPGTYAVMVKGSAASGAHSVTYALTVTAASGSITYQAEATSNTLAGSARVISCSACSGGARVGYLGGTGTLTMNNISVAAAGKYLIAIAYTNGDATNLQALISVNGGPNVTFTGGPTANWDTPASATITLTLAAGNNTIEFSNPQTSNDIPDIDKVTVPSTHS